MSARVSCGRMSCSRLRKPVAKARALLVPIRDRRAAAVGSRARPLHVSRLWAKSSRWPSGRPPRPGEHRSHHSLSRGANPTRQPPGPVHGLQSCQGRGLPGHRGPPRVTHQATGFDRQNAGQLEPDVRVGDWAVPWNAKAGARRLGPGIPKSDFFTSDQGDRPGRLRLHAQGFRVRLRRRDPPAGSRLPTDGQRRIGQPEQSYEYERRDSLEEEQ
jgi:hypothetical protein